MNACYLTMIYGDYDTHRQSSFCFYKINPSSGNLKWKNDYKPHSWGYRKSKMASWLFPAPWKTSLLFDRIKPFLAVGLISHNGKKWLKYIFCNLQWSGCLLYWIGRTDTGKNFMSFLETITFTDVLCHQTRTMKQKDWLHEIEQTAKYCYSFHDFLPEILLASNLCFRGRQWHPTLVLLPGKSHGWRSLVGCRLWVLTESDTTEAT